VAEAEGVTKYDAGEAAADQKGEHMFACIKIFSVI